MFLFERIVSLLTYAAALLLACVLLRNVGKRQIKLVFFLYLIALCVFAFAYKPYKTADLFRLRQYAQYWVNIPLTQIFSYAMRRNTPSWILFSYFANHLGSINWLQTLSCLWCFGNVFYIIAHDIARFGLTRHRRSLMLFYVMCIGTLYLETISGIRSMLGLSIVAFCFYRETIENKGKGKHIPLYLFAALLHPAAMVLTISRIFFLLLEYRNMKMKLLMLLFIAGLGSFSLYYLGDYISAATEKAQNYLTGEEYTYIWEILIGLIETASTILVLRKYRKTFSGAEGARGYDTARTFCLLWTVISVVALPFSYGVFRRYTVFCTLISVPLLGKDLQFEQYRYPRRMGRFTRLMWILAFIAFAISGVRGDLCGYKFFVLP